MAARVMVLLVLIWFAQDAPLQEPGTSGAALFDAYASGRQVDRAVLTFSQANGFVTELRESADAWIDAVPSEARKRRLVVASAALEVAASDLRAREAQRTLIPWATALLGADPPSDAERAWYRAANALAQRTADTYFANLPAQSLKRFPTDDRLHLARVLVQEQASWRAVQAAQRAGDRQAGVGILRTLASEFEALRSRAGIEAEVHVRLGHTYLRLDRHADAWTELARVEPLTEDRYLEYLARYFSGRARQGMNDVPGAIAGYRSALELFPRAQSASFALAALISRSEDPASAAALVQAAIGGADPGPDPWRTYQEGDYRSWAELTATLRQLR